MASFIADRGELRSGFGTTLSGFHPAPNLIQQLSLIDHKIEKPDMSIQLGVCHSTYFDDRANKTREGVGLAASWKICDIGWLASVRWPALKLSELRLGASIACDADYLIQGKLDANHTVVGANLGWKF